MLQHHSFGRIFLQERTFNFVRIHVKEFRQLLRQVVGQEHLRIELRQAASDGGKHGGGSGVEAI